MIKKFETKKCSKCSENKNVLDYVINSNVCRSCKSKQNTKIKKLINFYCATGK